MNNISNVEIINICNENRIPLVGIYSKDKIPKNLSDGYTIINLEDENSGNGTHWVSFNKQKNNIYYFDSFGIIYFENLKLLFPNHNISFNNKQIQDINSSACGWFSICLGWFISRKINSKIFIAQFSTNTNMNDFILNKILIQKKIL